MQLTSNKRKLQFSCSWSYILQVMVEAARWTEQEKTRSICPHGMNLGLPSSWLYEVSEKHRVVFYTVEHVKPITCFHYLWFLSNVFNKCFKKKKQKKNCADTSRLIAKLALDASSLSFLKLHHPTHLHRDKPEGRCQSLKREARAYVVVQNNRSVDIWNPNGNMGVTSDADTHPRKPSVIIFTFNLSSVYSSLFLPDSYVMPTNVHWQWGV